MILPFELLWPAFNCFPTPPPPPPQTSISTLGPMMASLNARQLPLNHSWLPFESDSKFFAPLNGKNLNLFLTKQWTICFSLEIKFTFGSWSASYHICIKGLLSRQESYPYTFQPPPMTDETCRQRCIHEKSLTIRVWLLFRTFICICPLAATWHFLLSSISRERQWIWIHKSLI